MVITAAAPRIKVDMGGCKVMPIGSPIVDYAGFYKSCSYNPESSFADLYYGPNYTAC